MTTATAPHPRRVRKWSLGQPRAHSRMGGRVPLGAAVAGGAVLTVVAALLSVFVGVQPLAPAAVLDALRGMPGDGETAAIIASRVDRTLIALVVGAAVALSGVVLQGLSRNPIAEPGILGLNSGAALAVVVGIRFLGLTTVTGYVVAAIVGTVVVAVLVQSLTMVAPRRSAAVSLALAGAAVMALSQSLIGAVLVTDRGALDSFRFWQVGSVAGRDAGQVLDVLPVLAVGAVLALASGPTLDAVALGDDVARGLGQHVLMNRGLAAGGAVLLAAAATALAGPIAFVGLVVPHAVRTVVGVGHRRVLVVSLLVGGAFVVLADVVGRLVAAPSEVQAGIVCAVLGAPVLVAVVRRAKGLG